MLTRDTFLTIARKLKAPSVGVFEKDYCISCLMDGISSIEVLASNFIFKGGTALRKVYFPDWRYSEDMDFSVLPEFKSEQFKNLLEALFKVTYSRHGIEIKLKRFHKPDGMVRVRLQYQGPLEHPTPLYLDVTFDERIVLKPYTKNIIETFSGSPTPIVLVYPLEEILAEKLCALIIRGKARDYYDVWRLLKEKKDLVDLAKVKEVFGQKCEHRNLEYKGSWQFTTSERIKEAQTYWDKELKNQLTALPEFLSIIAELREVLHTIDS